MYDFDHIMDRRNTASLKWDVKENELPMWVADMDFETAPAVKERFFAARKAAFTVIRSSKTTGTTP